MTGGSSQEESRLYHSTAVLKIAQGYLRHQSWLSVAYLCHFGTLCKQKYLSLTTGVKNESRLDFLFFTTR